MKLRPTLWRTCRVIASKTPEDAQAYLDKFIHDIPDHQAYLDFIGQERLNAAVAARERRE